MEHKGDTKRQAALRDRMIKWKYEAKEDIFVPRILSTLGSEMRLCDIGCGTAHIVRELAIRVGNASFVGLDISPAMIRVAYENTKTLPNVSIVKGDGLELPFSDCTLDVVAARLAEFSPKEVYRVLKEEGSFLKYGLGPEADKEIGEFFPDRIEEENFFIPRNPKLWKEEAYGEIAEAGFTIINIEDHKRKDYHQNEEEVMDLIEMVPLVRDFDRGKDRERIEELADKYGEEKGIGITWHYCIIESKK